MTQKNDVQLWQAWQEAVQEEVRTRPWFAALLLQKGSRLFDRFVHFYARLTAVGQRQHRRLAIGIGTAALALALSGTPTPAHAATITVDPDAIGIVDDNQCSLVEAIINANNGDQTHTDCDPGSNGPDIIVLPANSLHSHTTAHGTGSALPNITSEITIEANGATIARDATAGNMRIIRINSGGNLTLNNATITGGSGVNGGGIYTVGGTLTVNNSTIHGNSASDYGGGISIVGSGGSTTVNNSTISGNNAPYGGGIDIYNSGSLTLSNSTITTNTASGDGGGFSAVGTTVTLVRTIVSGNTAPTGAEIARGSGTVNADAHNVLGHSGLTNAQAFSNFAPPSGSDIIATSDGGGTPTPLSSILSPLANNGGPTLTHALVTGSPAIDIAPAANCSGAPISGVDQRGVSRSQDGNGDGTAACDAGAVEMGQLQCGIQAATLPLPLIFAQSSNVLVNVTDNGTNLDCVRVTEIGQDHPNATSSANNMALETGRYWQIAGYQNSTPPTAATPNFTVDLTLPFASADDNSRVCKWLGIDPPTTGFGWDCAGTGSGGLVTRTGIDSFSDWAVGDEVGPTAVSLQSITTISQQGGLAALMATLLTALSGIWLWVRRPGQAKREA